MNKSTVQPFRRNSALYRICEDLVLWLQLEENFADSSFYEQQAAELDNSTPTPDFSTSKYVTAPASADFDGTSSIGVIGDPDVAPDARLFDFNRGDFNIECNISIPDIDDHSEEMIIWDWGTLKLSIEAGVFAIHFPTHLNQERVEFYDALIHQKIKNGDWLWVSVSRDDGIVRLRIDGQVYSHDDEYRETDIVGLEEDDFKRSFGSDVKGENKFVGLIDEIRVYKDAIYNPGPIKIAEDGNLWAEGIYVDRGNPITQSTNIVNEVLISVCGEERIELRVDVETIYDPRMSCAKEPVPYIVKWFRDGQELIDDSVTLATGVEVDEYNNLLIFAPFEKEHEGTYCAEVHFPRNIFKSPPRMNCVKLTCNVPPTPPPPPPTPPIITPIVPTDTPAHTPVHTVVHTPAHTPVHTVVHTPAHTPVHTVVHTPAHTPVHTVVHTPAHTPKTTPLPPQVTPTPAIPSVPTPTSTPAVPPVPTSTTTAAGCPADVFTCPDGSYVGRDPNNNCNFFPCPPVPTPTPGICDESNSVGTTLNQENDSNVLCQLAVGEAINDAGLALGERVCIQFANHSTIYEVETVGLGTTTGWAYVRIDRNPTQTIPSMTHVCIVDCPAVPTPTFAASTPTPTSTDCPSAACCQPVTPIYTTSSYSHCFVGEWLSGMGGNDKCYIVTRDGGSVIGLNPSDPASGWDECNCCSDAVPTPTSTAVKVYWAATCNSDTVVILGDPNNVLNGVASGVVRAGDYCYTVTGFSSGNYNQAIDSKHTDCDDCLNVPCSCTAPQVGTDLHQKSAWSQVYAGTGWFYLSNAASDQDLVGNLATGDCIYFYVNNQKYFHKVTNVNTPSYVYYVEITPALTVNLPQGTEIYKCNSLPPWTAPTPTPTGCADKDMGTISCYQALDSFDNLGSGSCSGGVNDVGKGCSYLFKCQQDCTNSSALYMMEGTDHYSTDSVLCRAAKHKFGNTSTPWSQRQFKATVIGAETGNWPANTQNGVTTYAWINNGCWRNYTLTEITGTTGPAITPTPAAVTPTAAPEYCCNPVSIICNNAGPWYGARAGYPQYYCTNYGTNYCNGTYAIALAGWAGRYPFWYGPLSNLLYMGVDSNGNEQWKFAAWGTSYCAGQVYTVIGTKKQDEDTITFNGIGIGSVTIKFSCQDAPCISYNPPTRYLRVYWCRGSYVWANWNSSASLSVRVYNGYPPYTVVWKKNGIPISNGPKTTISGSDGYCDSVITFYNIKSNILGITAHVTDFMGNAATVSPAGTIYVRMPNLISPYITDATVTNATETAALSGGCCDTAVRNYTNKWNINRQASQTTVTIKVDAKDINPPELLTAKNLTLPLQYRWRDSGNYYAQWIYTGSRNTLQVTLKEGETKNYYCQVYVNNIFAGSYYDRWKYAQLVLTIGHAQCDPPAAFIRQMWNNASSESLSAESGSCLTFKYLYMRADQTIPYWYSRYYNWGPSDFWPSISAGKWSSIANVVWYKSPYINWQWDYVSFDKTFWYCDGATQQITVRFSNGACGQKTLTSTVAVAPAKKPVMSGSTSPVVFTRQRYGGSYSPYTVYRYFNVNFASGGGGYRRMNLRTPYYNPYGASCGNPYSRYASTSEVHYIIYKNNQVISGLTKWTGYASFNLGCLRMSMASYTSGAITGWLYFYQGYSSCWKNGDVVTVRFYGGRNCSNESPHAAGNYSQLSWTINVNDPPIIRWPWGWGWPRYYYPYYYPNTYGSRYLYSYSYGYYYGASTGVGWQRQYYRVSLRSYPYRFASIYTNR